MRIISGLAKGRRLYGPKSPSIRPVSDKVKGALFNILPSLEGCRVLDLFAGSGSVGLEAASRGADHVVFVDASPQALALLQKNIRQCGFERQTTVIRGTVPEIIKRLARKELKFDAIFVDPPYDKNLVNPTLEALIENKLIDAQTDIIIEHSPREVPDCGGLAVADQRKYGQTFVTFMRLPSHSE
ncbi:MAG: 16S rRNA (guanine(966)-N(2))-methyltransferase RsmD [Deltaproteobacteria bacterium]|nr:16S rRNA (guanine(966)-N(2))-methyltransferase RsmD [Deltaproteobacteria bacterium]